MILYTFFREGGFYPIELQSDDEARSNAECNPGTIKVVNEVTKVVVWQLDGVQRIAAERQRQITREGWTREHDAQRHSDGSLSYAAATYAITGLCDDPAIDLWPREWGLEWYKPSDSRIRNLEKAGALIAAEIDRLTEFPQ